MIYSFVTVEGVEATALTIAFEITQPRWSLSLAETRTDRGALSQGLPNKLAMHFILNARNLILGLAVPDSEDQSPRLIETDKGSRLLPLDSKRHSFSTQISQFHA